jgi:GntR family transcriptional regulator
VDFDRRTRVLQVHEELLELIRRDALEPGERFPSEAELSERFGVSRGTVREALKLMEQDGILHVYHGRGRFLAAAAALHVSRPVTRFESVTEMLASRGYVLDIRVVSVGITRPTPEEAADWGLCPDEELVHLERVRLYKGEVIVVSVNSFCASLLGDQDVTEVDFSTSLMEWLEQRGSGPVSSAAEIRATALPARFAALPEVDDQQPWLLIVEECVERSGAFVLHSEDYHRGDFVSFHVLRRYQE